MAEGDGDAWRWFKELRAEVLEAQKIRAQIVRAQGHLPELVAITTDGAYTDHAHVDAAVKAVFTEMTELLEAEGATLAVSESSDFLRYRPNEVRQAGMRLQARVAALRALTERSP